METNSAVSFDRMNLRETTFMVVSIVVNVFFNVMDYFFQCFPKCIHF
jgi:hypothetical protein